MEDSWRFRAIQGSICPTCSVSHFPFCSQPLSFDRNRFVLADTNPTFHRPFPDSLDNRTVHGSFPHNDTRASPIDSNQSWNQNRGLEREPANSSYVEDERFLKRIRVDYTEPGPFDLRLPSDRNNYMANVTRISNLIREHGGYSGLQVEVGVDSSIWSRSSVQSDYPINRSFHGRSVNDSRLDGLNAVERVSFDEQRPNVVTNNIYAPGFASVDQNLSPLPREPAFKNMPPLPREPVFNNMPPLPREPVFDNMPPLPREPVFDNRLPLPREPVFNYQNQSMQGTVHGQNFRINDRSMGQPERTEFYREEYGLGLDQHRTQSNDSNGFVSDADQGYRNEPHGHRHFGQTDNFFHHPSSNNLAGALNYMDSDRQTQDSMNHIRGENESRNMNWGELSISISQQPQIPHYSSDHVPRDARETISSSSYDHQQVKEKEFSYITPKPPQYVHPATWQVPLSPNGRFNEQKSFHMLSKNRLINSQSPQPLNMLQHHEENKHTDAMRPFKRPFEPYDFPVAERFDARNRKNEEFYPMIPTGNITTSRASAVPSSYPPLPPQPPPMDQPGPPPSSPPTTTSIHTGPFSSSSAAPLPLPQSIQAFPEVQPLPQAYFYNKPLLGASTGFSAEDLKYTQQTLSKQCQEEGPLFPVKHSPPDKLKVIDASLLFRCPHRATRPDHIVIILRGLPGSGKSYLAKTLRDLEVENGGKAPRIHSMDDYFMTEVEKDEESEGSKSSSSVKGKKRGTKKVMEYCYEPEMEEAYRSSMLKAFKKTLEEGIFTFIIVDDRNLRVADFAQFWATAKMSGYEVYLLEATYKDPMGCAARNVHGFTSDDIQKMADRWEQAPPLYLQLDVQSLFQGDDLNERGIQEVDMDMEEVSCDEHPTMVQDPKSLTILESPSPAYPSDGALKLGERWDTEEDDQTQEVKEIGRSKWSDELDEDIDEPESGKGHLNALSGLINAYGRGEKSVHWGDRVGKSGFSIGAAKKEKILSLVIGPGSGYNLDSNPMAEDENVDAIELNSGDSRRNVFLEQLRAERESFKVVFDRRRQRIRGLEIEDE